MKTLIKILCLSVLWFSCESEDESEDAFVEIYHLNMDIMMRFSHHLDLSQFEFQYFSDLINSDEEILDTTGIYFISNSDIFGTDCYLFYDDNKKTLTGYVETTEMAGPTGNNCYPNYIHQLKLSNGLILNENFEIDTILTDYYPYTVPNPYFGSSLFNEDIYGNRITFDHLPQNRTINVFDGSLEELVYTHVEENTLEGLHFWNLDSTIVSGAYYYEIISNSFPTREGSTIIIRPKE